jgi:hypothetical protein
MTSPQNDKWRVSLHEAGHLIVGKCFKPHETFKAEICYASKYDAWTGLCSTPFPKLGSIHEGIFCAAGKEAERFQGRFAPPQEEPQGAPLADATTTEPAPTTTTTEPGDKEQIFIKKVLQCTSDPERLGQIIASLYNDYQNVPDWPATHRNWRYRALQILRRNSGELVEIATAIYLNGFYVYKPGAGAFDGVDVQKQNREKEGQNYVTVNS